MDFDSITLGQMVQLGVTLVAVAGAYFTLRAKVHHMEERQTAHKQEMDARFKAAGERDLYHEAQLSEHIKETNQAFRDITQLNTKMDMVVESLRRIESKE